MTQTQTNQPADTIRYMGVKGVIWRNAGKDGKPDRYTVQYFRTYKDEKGEFKDTSSLSEIDNLKLQVLTPQIAYRIAELTSADREAENADNAHAPEVGQ